MRVWYITHPDLGSPRKRGGKCCFLCLSLPLCLHFLVSLLVCSPMSSPLPVSQCFYAYKELSLSTTNIYSFHCSSLSLKILLSLVLSAPTVWLCKIVNLPTLLDTTILLLPTFTFNLLFLGWMIISWPKTEWQNLHSSPYNHIQFILLKAYTVFKTNIFCCS